tara:strand:- start:1066 stop:2250 length:1185 start_codon:yes stop_codon:yes gene_type:complete
MPEYKCDKCDKIFKHKGSYTRHLNRKTPCKRVIETTTDKIKAISLFSGMGGDSHGILKSECELVAYSEIEKIFRESHDLNFKNCELLGDGNITKTKDEDFLKYKDEVNLIFAGFPCQGFSNAGKKLADDPRNTLFKEFLRATKLIEPNYIIGENVKGLLKRKTNENELYIDIIKSEFENIGYDITYEVLKCHEYGIPQSRERLIIVGIKKSLNKKYEFPKKLDLKPNLEKIIKFNMEGALKIEPTDFDMTTIPNKCIIKNLENDETEDLEDKIKKPHPNLILLAKNRDYVYKDIKYPNRLTFGKRIPVGGEIIDIRKPSKTIICTYARQPRLFVPQQNKNGYYLRCLLPDELKQIQGFPKDYKISGDKSKQIIQIGNAVPPPLIKLIVESLLKI